MFTCPCLNEANAQCYHKNEIKFTFVLLLCVSIISQTPMWKKKGKKGKTKKTQGGRCFQLHSMAAVVWGPAHRPQTLHNVQIQLWWGANEGGGSSGDKGTLLSTRSTRCHLCVIIKTSDQSDYIIDWLWQFSQGLRDLHTKTVQNFGFTHGHSCRFKENRYWAY